MAPPRARASGGRCTAGTRAVNCARTLDRTPCAPSTVIWKVQEAEFPAASVAVLMTVVGPIGKRLPDGGTETADKMPEQLSVAWMSKLTVAPLSSENSTIIS